VQSEFELENGDSEAESLPMGENLKYHHQTLRVNELIQDKQESKGKV